MNHPVLLDVVDPTIPEDRTLLKRASGSSVAILTTPDEDRRARSNDALMRQYRSHEVPAHR
jgi:hypothetical protein